MGVVGLKSLVVEIKDKVKEYLTNMEALFVKPLKIWKHTM
jgi:hypothetical protein